MQKANNHQGKLRNAVFLFVAALIVLADQLTKIWIRSALAVGQSIPDTGFFRLTHAHNSGAVFGLFQGQSFYLAILASLIIAALVFYGLFISRRFPLLDSLPGRIALGLLLGGAVGNLIDRLRFGYVTDFIDAGLWPAFNVADSAVTVGVIIFIGSFLCLSKRAEQR